MSTTSKVVSNDTDVLTYGSATLYGNYMKDNVCLDLINDICAKDFTFFEITRAKGLKGLDGILGFSPDNMTNTD